MVDIAIHDHGAANEPVALRATNGDGDIVNGAESLAVPWKRVVKTAAEIKPDAFLERQARGQDAAAGRQPESLDHALRIWNFQAQDLVISEGSGLEPLHPAGRRTVRSRAERG